PLLWAHLCQPPGRSARGRCAGDTGKNHGPERLRSVHVPSLPVRQQGEVPALLTIVRLGERTSGFVGPRRRLALAMATFALARGVVHENRYFSALPLGQVLPQGIANCVELPRDLGMSGP